LVGDKALETGFLDSIMRKGGVLLLFVDVGMGPGWDLGCYGFKSVCRKSGKGLSWFESHLEELTIVVASP